MVRTNVAYIKKRDPAMPASISYKFPRSRTERRHRSGCTALTSGQHAKTQNRNYDSDQNADDVGCRSNKAAAFMQVWQELIRPHKLIRNTRISKKYGIEPGRQDKVYTCGYVPGSTYNPDSISRYMFPHGCDASCSQSLNLWDSWPA